MRLNIHPDNPQQRLIQQAVNILEKGGVIIYPTDTVYGIGCDVENRKAIERVYQLKKVDSRKPMSLVCPDLSVLSDYSCNVATPAFRILKRLTPGPYTFILDASSRIPRTLLTRQRTIGLRIPDSRICHALTTTLGRPILSTSIRLEDLEHFTEDPDDIEDEWGKRVDLVIDGGILKAEPSTVVDLTSGAPEILRVGKGPVDSLL